MSGFESHRSRIDNELLQSLMRKNQYLNDVILQLEQKIQALEAKIKVLETENQNLKRKPASIALPAPPISKFGRRPRKLNVMVSDSIDNFKMREVNSSFTSDHKTTSKRLNGNGGSQFLFSPVPRSQKRTSSDELIGSSQPYNNQKGIEKSKKYYEDLGNSIVAPLYLLKTTKQVISPTNVIESEAEEIVFREEGRNRNSGGSTHKENPITINNEKTVLNFVKSPIHRTPMKRKSILSATLPQPQNDSFTARANLLVLHYADQSKPPGSEPIFEDLFVIGLDKTELKPGVQQQISPHILKTLGFSEKNQEKEWFFTEFFH